MPHRYLARRASGHKKLTDKEKPLMESGDAKLAECRICLEEDNKGNMENPCACSGTLKYAHRKCLERWSQKKGDSICELCNQQYTVRSDRQMPRGDSNIRAGKQYTVRSDRQMPRGDSNIRAGKQYTVRSDSQMPRGDSNSQAGKQYKTNAERRSGHPEGPDVGPMPPTDYQRRRGRVEGIDPPGRGYRRRRSASTDLQSLRVGIDQLLDGVVDDGWHRLDDDLIAICYSAPREWRSIMRRIAVAAEAVRAMAQHNAPYDDEEEATDGDNEEEEEEIEDKAGDSDDE